MKRSILGGLALLTGCSSYSEPEVIPWNNTPIYQEEVVKIGLDADLDRLNNVGYPHTFEKDDLISAIRVLYFECKDPKAVEGKEWNIEKLDVACTAVAEVMRNRYLFDNCLEDSPVINTDCDQSRWHADEGLREMVLAKDLNSKTKKTEHQYSAVFDHPFYFTEEALSTGKLNHSAYWGRKERKKDWKESIEGTPLQVAYDSFMKVWVEGDTNESKNAFFYKNSKDTNLLQSKKDRLKGKKVKWHNTLAFMDVKDDCNDSYFNISDRLENNVQCRAEISYVRDWTVDILSHQFYELRFDVSETIWDNTEACTYYRKKKGSNDPYSRRNCRK